MIQMKNGEKLWVQPFSNSKYKNCSLAELIQEDLKAPLTYRIDPAETSLKVTGEEVLFGTMFGALEYRLLNCSDITDSACGFDSVIQLLELEAVDSRKPENEKVYAKHLFSLEEKKHKAFVIYQEIEAFYRCEIHLSEEEFNLLAQLLQKI